MLAAACVGTNNLDAATDFYDRLMETLGFARVSKNEHEAGYGLPSSEAQFWVLTPYNKKPATVGNGSQVMFRVPSSAEVKAFYSAALAAGGEDDGQPGPRDYRPGYYGAYCRDLDGNKLHVFSIEDD